ncbi:MAG: ribosome small subunit-dependent GTPase A [bacterium]
MFDLEKLGWDAHFEKSFEPFRNDGYEAGRIAVESKDRYVIQTKFGEVTGETSGKLRFTAESNADLPKVGDWVALTYFENEKKAIIHNILERKTKFSRKVAGKRTEEQIIASNIDVVFVVQSLDLNFSVRRLERYLVMVSESKARPVIVLNKSDLCDRVKNKLAEVKDLGKDVPILPMSAKTGQGLRKLKSFIKEGLTFAFVGSSGVGKSTLINKIMGEDVQATAEVRKDSKGRHTTAQRELIILPKGGCLIDTPGMRELQLWHSEEGLNEAFEDVEKLARHCHFSDCSHKQEKRCAVLDAVETGALPQERYESYLKLQKELHRVESQRDTLRFLEKKKKEKELHRMIKKIATKRTSKR